MIDLIRAAAVLGGDISGSQILCPGPGHSAADRSLSVRFDEHTPNGLLVHSFAGDDPIECKDYVRQKLGWAEWKPNGHAAGYSAEDAIRRMSEKARGQPKQNGASGATYTSRRVVTEYVYQQADGTPYLKVLKYNCAPRFKQKRWTGSGWEWKKPAGDPILYRLPELLAAFHDMVFIVEGEKDADRLAGLDPPFVATTNPEGAGKWKECFNRFFSGKTVHILADNDDTGRAHALDVARNLHGVAREVRIVDLRELPLEGVLPEKGDISDWLNMGGDYTKLIKMCEAFPLWEPAEEEERDKSSGQWQWRFFGRTQDIIDRLYLIDKLLPETGVGLISGQWGTYKTFAALDLAAAVITKTAFAGFEVVRQGAVLFIALEGGGEVDIRMRAALAHRGYTDELAPFAWIDTCPRLLDPDAGNIIAAMVQQAAEKMLQDFGLPVVLAIVDTAGKAAGYSKAGEENDAVAGRQIVMTLAEASKATGALFLGVDHFGKAVETGTRGTSAKEADCDVVLALLGDKNMAGEVKNPRLAIRKRRSGANGEEIGFTPTVVTIDDDETTLVIDWNQAKQAMSGAKPDKWTKSLRLLRQTLMNALVDLGTEQRPFPDGPTIRAVDIEHVRAEFYKSYPAEGDEKAKQAARQKAFKRAVNAAQENGLIGVRDIGAATFVWPAGSEP